MGYAMAQVGRFLWKINMVGTLQSNRTGGGSLGAAAIERKEIQKGTNGGTVNLIRKHSTKRIRNILSILY